MTEGREIPALEAVLARLAPGQIAAEPVEDVDVEYLIPRRVELAALPRVPEPRFELPAGPAAAAP